jgi:myo-inositol-1(or 4)-monophosphatase
MNQMLRNVTAAWPFPMRILTDAVLEAGMAIPCLPRTFEVKAGEGHRSGVTKGDEMSRDILFSKLTEAFPEALILSEEESSHPQSLPKENPQGILGEGLRFVIDPLDSTARYGQKMDGWSVGGGMLICGDIMGGAVFAPASNGGLLVAATIGQGVTIVEWDGRQTNTISSIALPETPPKKSVVLLGVDALLYGNIATLNPTIAANVRAVFTSGSGLLGLAWVAARRAQAIIQTPQKAWDWVGAYRAIIESGNVFRFFRIVEGNLVPVETYDFDAFRTLKNSNANRLGFVAGEPDMAERLFNLLPKTGWERTIPDTVSGMWK